jgi:hypothetical protein
MVLDPRRSDFADRFRGHLLTFRNQLGIDMDARRMNIGGIHIPTIPGGSRYIVEQERNRVVAPGEDYASGGARHGMLHVQIPHETGLRSDLTLYHVRENEGLAHVRLRTVVNPLKFTMTGETDQAIDSTDFTIDNPVHLRALLGRHFNAVDEHLRKNKNPIDYGELQLRMQTKYANANPNTIHGSLYGLWSNLAHGSFDLGKGSRFTEKNHTWKDVN